MIVGWLLDDCWMFCSEIVGCSEIVDLWICFGKWEMRHYSQLVFYFWGELMLLKRMSAVAVSRVWWSQKKSCAKKTHVFACICPCICYTQYLFWHSRHLIFFLPRSRCIFRCSSKALVLGQGEGPEDPPLTRGFEDERQQLVVPSKLVAWTFQSTNGNKKVWRTCHGWIEIQLKNIMFEGPVKKEVDILKVANQTTRTHEVS